MRIDLIDNFRAMAMIYVLFIHCLYWTNLFLHDVKSLFLIEMPLFFTIIGMSHYFANTDNLKKFYISKIKRLMIPYWICAGIYIFLNIVALKFEIQPLLDPENATFTEMLVEWLNPFMKDKPLSPVPFLHLAVWFIPIYILVSLIIPFLKKFFIELSDNFKILPALFLFIASLYFSMFAVVPYKLQSMLFYAFWVYLGFYYISTLNNKPVREKLLFCMALSIGSAVLLFILRKYGHFAMDMQINKFPPNIIFLLYNLFWIPIIYLFSQQINKILCLLCRFKPWAWIFHQYKYCCYSIFLYHPLAFLIMYRILDKCKLNYFFENNGLIGLLIYWTIIVVIAAIFGSIFGRLEKLK